MEKLLRCTSLRRIYLLIRAKRGNQAEDRLKGLLSARAFDRLYKEIKCTRDSEILHEIVRDTTRKSEKHELISVICEVSRTIWRSITNYFV